MTEHLTNEMQALREQLTRIEQKIDQPTGEELRGRWLNGEQAQEILNVRPRTLQKYREERLIGYSQVGSKIYYRATDLEAHLMRHFIPSRNSRH
ncbi:MAG: helix-turn-helix domain-containing protein [Bacteroidota bacterium]